MIKTTIKQLDNAIRSGALARFASDTGLPVKTSFKLARIVKQVSGEYETYEQARVKLVEHWAKKDEDGKVAWDENKNAVFETPEDHAAFQNDGRELLEAEIELAGEPITLDELAPRKMTAGEFLSANDLVLLDWLIVEGAVAEAVMLPRDAGLALARPA